MFLTGRLDPGSAFLFIDKHSLAVLVHFFVFPLHYVPPVSYTHLLREKAQDTTPIMRRCADVLAGAAEGAFDDEADPVTGAKWQPLAASTAAARAAKGHSGKILQLTGSLASSLERDFGRTYAVVGTAKPYAAAHQFGAVTKPHVIRARNGRALKIPGVGFRRSVNQMCIRDSIGTARRWKTDAQKAEDDDWDKVKAASSLAGEGMEAVARQMLNDYVLQHKTLMERIGKDEDMRCV